jgi:hypothetical protein
MSKISYGRAVRGWPIPGHVIAATTEFPDAAGSAETIALRIPVLADWNPSEDAPALVGFASNLRSSDVHPLPICHKTSRGTGVLSYKTTPATLISSTCSVVNPTSCKTLSVSRPIVGAAKRIVPGVPENFVGMPIIFIRPKIG